MTRTRLDHHKAIRRLAIGGAIAVFGLLLSGCGSGHKHRAHRPPAVSSGSATQPEPAPDVLSLAGLGTFEGSCPRGASSWTVRFVDKAGATDTVSYRVGRGPRHRVTVGDAINFHLVPDAWETHEPADRFAPPIGQGRGRTNATTLPTTPPIDAVIYQGTEPQTLRADVHLALAAIGGESGRCVLVGSRVSAYTYPNG